MPADLITNLESNLRLSRLTNSHGETSAFAPKRPVDEQAVPQVTVRDFIKRTVQTDTRLDAIVQFFASPSCDPSGYGEGRTYLGEEDVTTDSNGFASVSMTSLPLTPVGSFVTATATRLSSAPGPMPMDTSEFSACYQVTHP